MNKFRSRITQNKFEKWIVERIEAARKLEKIKGLFTDLLDASSWHPPIKAPSHCRRRG
jgi:hypothetical protein